MCAAKDYKVVMNWLEVINNIYDIFGMNFSKFYDTGENERRKIYATVIYLQDELIADTPFYIYPSVYFG